MKILIMCIAWKLKIRKIYGRKSNVHVQHESCIRCSLIPLARKNLLLPHKRPDAFANFQNVVPVSRSERKRNWS